MKREAQSAPVGPKPEMEEHFFMLAVPKGAIPNESIKLLFILMTDGTARWMEAETLGSVTVDSPRKSETPPSESSSTSSTSSWLTDALGDPNVDVDPETCEWIWDEELGAYLTSHAAETLARQRKGSSDKM